MARTLDGREILRVAKTTLKEAADDKLTRHAAALAYYTLLALAPLLVVAIAIAGLVFGAEATEGRLVSQIEGAVGPQAAQMVQEMVAGAASRGVGSGIVAAVGSGVFALVVAASLFGHLEDALNTIWEVEPVKRKGRWTEKVKVFLKEKIPTFLLVFLMGILLVASLVVSAVISGLHARVGDTLPGSGWLWQFLSFLASFTLLTVLFAMIYYYLPDTDIAWKDVWVGAALTSALVGVGRIVLGFYFGRGTFESTYGAAASVIVLLVWTYYNAILIFLGAEFTQVWANRQGDGVSPDAGARSKVGESPPAADRPSEPPGADRARKV